VVEIEDMRKKTLHKDMKPTFHINLSPFTYRGKVAIHF